MEKLPTKLKIAAWWMRRKIIEKIFGKSPVNCL
jgi:hypothetical protein